MIDTTRVSGSKGDVSISRWRAIAYTMGFLGITVLDHVFPHEGKGFRIRGWLVWSSESLLVSY